MINTATSTITSTAGAASSGAVEFTQIATSALGDVDSFNKVWGVLIAAIAVIAAAALSSFAAAIVQFISAYQQRKHERKASEEESAETARLAENKLSMADATSQRKANAKVALMRQVWINELRQDTATYLALWQDIAFRWAAMIANPNERAFGSITADSLNAPIAKMRHDAHELQLRIEMRLNPNEQVHKDLRRLMDLLESVVGDFCRDKSRKSAEALQLEVSEAIQAIVSKQQEILKEEWNVVKRELGINLKQSTRTNSL